MVRRPVLTDRQLNTAVAIARVSPGPFGLYLVPVGYYAGGWPGAIAGFAAMVTPAFLILAMLRSFARRTLDRRALSAIQAVTHASAGLVLASVIPITRDALTAPWQFVLAALVTAAMVATRWDTAWVVAAGAVCGLLAG